MGVLDDMTKGITDRKAKATGSKLTPVGLEASGIKPSIMPKDLPGRYMAGEEVTTLARDLRAKAEQLVSIADALDSYVGESSAPILSPKDASAVALKEAEKEGDRKAAVRKASEPEPLPELDVIDESFTERLDRLSNEAQAAVFTAADVSNEEPELPEGWVCPDHGGATLKRLESRRGRKYMACQTAGCREFEKE